MTHNQILPPLSSESHLTSFCPEFSLLSLWQSQLCVEFRESYLKKDHLRFLNVDTWCGRNSPEVSLIAKTPSPPMRVKTRSPLLPWSGSLANTRMMDDVTVAFSLMATWYTDSVNWGGLSFSSSTSTSIDTLVLCKSDVRLVKNWINREPTNETLMKQKSSTMKHCNAFQTFFLTLTQITSVLSYSEKPIFGHCYCNCSINHTSCQKSNNPVNNQLPLQHLLLRQ